MGGQGGGPIGGARATLTRNDALARAQYVSPAFRCSVLGNLFSEAARSQRCRTALRVPCACERVIFFPTTSRTQEQVFPGLLCVNLYYPLNWPESDMSVWRSSGARGCWAWAWPLLGTRHTRACKTRKRAEREAERAHTEHTPGAYSCAVRPRHTVVALSFVAL